MAERETIVVTGCAGRLGWLLVRRLHRIEGVQVIGIDRRVFRGKPKDVEHFRSDIRRKQCEDLFRTHRVTAILHLGIMHDPRRNAEEHHTWNMLGTQRMLEYARRYDVPKVVILSTAGVYGPRPDNAALLTEDAPLLAAQDFPEIRDLIAVDMFAQSFFWKHPGTETVVLRPVHIVGSVRNAASNYLRLKPIPTMMGFDPMIQIIHEEDVVTALALARKPGLRGIFNIVGPPELPLSMLIREAGKAALPVPSFGAVSLLERMFRLRASGFPAPELDNLRYNCTVDGTRARDELGFTPAFTVRDAVRRAVFDAIQPVPDTELDLPPCAGELPLP